MKPSKGLPILGLTGFIGSGKSTVRGMLSARGAFCLDADVMAHEVMKRGQPAYAPIIAAFGAGVLGDDGEINRRKLGARVFGSPDMETLNAIVHPLVRDETLRQIAAAAGRYAFAVIDAPLLIEAGMHMLCDQVWWVSAPEDARKARVMARDKLTEAEAAVRIFSRAGEDALRACAQAVIHNDGDEAALARQVEEALQGWVYA